MKRIFALAVAADLGPPAARQSWLIFRTTVPLTDDEFKTIAGNAAPYFR